MNAREEILNHIDGREVEYISVAFRKDWSSLPVEIKGTLEEVLPSLNFEYDNGYGSQELGGCIWYTDGTWSKRAEYDGSEWWEHYTKPDYNVNVGGMI